MNKTSSLENKETAGSIDFSNRVRSPTPLEYASDNPVPGLSKEVGHEESPDYSKWVYSDYFEKMQTWLAKVDLEKLPSNKEEVRTQF